MSISNEDYNTIYDDIEYVKSQVEKYRKKLEDTISWSLYANKPEEINYLRSDIVEYTYKFTIWNRCLKNLLAVIGD